MKGIKFIPVAASVSVTTFAVLPVGHAFTLNTKTTYMLVAPTLVVAAGHSGLSATPWINSTVFDLGPASLSFDGEGRAVVTLASEAREYEEVMYSDLQQGDVFALPSRPGDRAVRLDLGYAWLTDGMSYCAVPWSHAVRRYGRFGEVEL